MRWFEQTVTVRHGSSERLNWLYGDAQAGHLQPPNNKRLHPGLRVQDWSVVPLAAVQIKW